MDALELVSTWPAPSAAGVLQRAPVGSDGSREVRLLGAVGDDQRLFEWASVTKLCAATALLVALEEGTVALDEHAGPPEATVKHLLAHASGLGAEARDGVVAQPGRRRIYSNAGFEVLAEHLEARAGLPYRDYLREAVFEPLGMRAELREDSSPAHGVRGTLRDLLVLGAELLAPRLVAPATLDLATEVAFPGLAGVLPGYGRQDPCDWGLGFEIKDGKAPHWTGSKNSARTFGHFGQSGSFLWVDPEVGVLCAALSDLEFGPWAKAAWPEFADRVLDEIAAAPGG